MTRWVNIAVAAVLGWCAIVQYNDPDPVLWIAVYAAGAAMAGLAAAGRYYTPALLLLGAVILFWMGTLAHGVGDFFAQGDPGLLVTGMSPERPYVELTREFLGLGIILASCSAYLWVALRQQSR
jgi:hypothetical protein